MDITQVRAALDEVLTSIQAASNLVCPKLTGSTKPVEELPDFDSVIWPVATGMLADKLGIAIPSDENIFVRPGTDEALTIDEIVALVHELVKSQATQVSKQASA